MVSARRFVPVLALAVAGALARAPAARAADDVAAIVRLQGFPARWAQEIADELRSAGLWVSESTGPGIVLRLHLERTGAAVCVEREPGADDCVHVPDDPTRRAVRRRLWIAVVERLRAQGYGGRLAGHPLAPARDREAVGDQDDVEEEESAPAPDDARGRPPATAPAPAAASTPAPLAPAAVRFGVGMLLGVPEPDLGMAKHAGFLFERSFSSWAAGWGRLLWPLQQGLVEESAAGDGQQARLWSSAIDAGVLICSSGAGALRSHARLGVGAHGLMFEGIRAEARSQRAGARLHGAVSGAVGLRLRLQAGLQVVLETELRYRAGLVPREVSTRVADALTGLSGALSVTLLFDVR